MAGAGVVPGVRALSSAAPSSVSTIEILSVGSSSFRKTPSVALMMPAPTRTTSGSLAARFSIMGFSNQRDIWHERLGLSALQLVRKHVNYAKAVGLSLP